MTRLRVYADRDCLPDNAPPCILLAPFWGLADSDPITGDGRIYAPYMQDGARLVELTALDAADFALVPANWEHYAHPSEAVERLRRLAERAAQAGKPLVVFYRGDYEFPVDLGAPVDLRVFRTSLTRSARRPGEQTLPAWSADLLDDCCGGKVRVRDKGARPVVGFCGDMSSGSHPLTRLKRLIGQHPARYALFKRIGVELIDHPGARHRWHAVHALRRAQSQGVDLNLVLRYGYWNGSVYRGAVRDAHNLAQSRAAYVENMLSSDYVLCVRGKGNYSYRFYETLCCGRIPLVVDTGGVLPFEDWIDWSRYGVWVGADELPHIGERVRAFHAGLTPDAFREMQAACRQLWLDWLSPRGFFANLHRYFAR
ncbi:MAG: exostosin family protein [Anaerolineae bacterium]|nr:exostosin family protein [Anaerolineae bacterium]